MCTFYRRSVTGVDFARQLAEQRREASGQPPTKRFKSSAAPKGTKYASGYQDRTLARRQQESEENGEAATGGDADDRARRVQALEEMMKLGQIDMATFEKLRADIGVGGDVGSTHMIKGLDWKLLQRVKAGEDITKEPEPESGPAKEGEDEANVDEEFERVLGEKEDAVRPVVKEEKVKKSNMAPPPPPPGQKKTRDQILKELKASRLGGGAAAQQKPEPPASTLGTRFKKIGDGSEKKRWIEKDEKGRRREVLLTTDAEGKTKRKVRWIDKPGGSQNGDAQGGQLLMPDREAKPLGMEVPADVSLKTSAAEPEDEDEDIFEGVGAEYNPLGDIGDEESSSSSESEGEVKEKSTILSEEHHGADEERREEQNTKDTVDTSSPEPKKPRNYFSSTSTDPTAEDPSHNPFSTDPTILAALKRAANIRQSSPSGEDADSNDPDAHQRGKKFLEEARKREMQDAMDMDVGFGGSRFGDEEDDEGVLWADEKGGGNKRKRGPRKRKGDKDSAGDVMKVLEGRKKEGGDKGKGK